MKLEVSRMIDLLDNAAKNEYEKACNSDDPISRQIHIAISYQLADLARDMHNMAYPWSPR